MAETSLVDAVKIDPTAPSTEESNEGASKESTNNGTPASWYFAENIAGDGDKPEWFNDKKYKSISDQAKAQRDLEKKLGAFTGAPEQYEMPNFEDLGLEFNKEDMALNNFMKVAKELNISQDAFGRIMRQYGETIKAAMPDPKKELAKLGENPEQQIQNLYTWASSKLDNEEMQTFKGLILTAEHVRLFQKLKNSNRELPIPGASGMQKVNKVTRGQIEERMKDPRYKDDKDYQAEVFAMIQQLVGE
jgi:hypothetical protein